MKSLLSNCTALIGFVLILQNVVNSFMISNSRFSSYKRQAPQMASDVVVVGLSGGVAESLSLKLSELGVDTTTILDSRPCSPKLSKLISDKKISYYYGDIDKGLKTIPSTSESISIEKILNNKVVIIIGDEGDEILRQSLPLDKNDRKQSKNIISKAINELPTTIQGIICAISSSNKQNTNTLNRLFGGKGANELISWCQENKKPYTLLTYGQLIGGIPGRQPIPFIGLPLQEPELNPCYKLQSAVLSIASNKFAADEICTRDCLTEVLARISWKDIYNLQAQVISIEGSTPKERDWEQIFARVASSSDVELLKINFGAILKLTAFTNWLVDSWFPQALIEADAATILSGARPVRAIKKSDGIVRIIWEDLQPDYTVRAAGEHEIRITTGDDETLPSISVVRMTIGALPGEIQLMERLVEGINKNVYKKQFFVPQE